MAKKISHATFEGENGVYDPFFLSGNGSNIQKSTPRQKLQEVKFNDLILFIESKMSLV